MKILQITAGAAGMYSGSCLRDNALASELSAQGHDVTLLPLFTPTLSDEENVSLDKVFFGGISVYLEQRSHLFRNAPGFLDRIWDSRYVLKTASRRLISTKPEFLGATTVSLLQGESGYQQKEFVKLIRWLKEQPLPDVISLPSSLLIGLAGPLQRALNRPVCCTLQGEDLFLQNLPELYRHQALELIRGQIDDVDTFVAVSDYYAGFMSRYLAIPRDRIEVAPLGIRFDGHSPRIDKPEHFTIGYFGRIAPEKGLHLLAQAYRLLRENTGLPMCCLAVAGYLPPEHKSYLAGIQKKMKDWGLGQEFLYHGMLDREQKIKFLRDLSVFSMPTVYPEPKGLPVLEAMANGVPVVQPSHGAFPEMLKKTSGGLLVDPGEPSSLARGLLSVLRDPAFAEELSNNASAGVRKYYSLANMAEKTVAAYEAAMSAPA